jgi:hypothetical protein
MLALFPSLRDRLMTEDNKLASNEKVRASKKKKKNPYVDWTNIPGGFDALNTRYLYASSNRLGIPSLPPAPLSAIPEWLAPYRTRIRDQSDLVGGAVHFFLKDYQFESVWRRPVKTLSNIKNQWGIALSPDFSLFYDCPLIMQMWNIYRSRWVGRWWIANGVTVIPTVAWASYASYDFCFLGLPSRSVLAVSTVGTRKNPSAKIPFLAGFKEMLKRLEPTAVLCYGDAYPEMLGLTNLHLYPDFWKSIAHARKKYGRRDQYDNYPDIPEGDIDIDV